MLNQQQQEAAHCVEGPLRIIAGPGTGKTKILVERAVNLIQKGHIEPNRILLLTFTNKAAHEIKERLTARGFSEVYAMTFHSLAARFLREFWNHDFEIVEELPDPPLKITFDQLLTTLIDLWREKQNVLAACQARFDAIMVDEYQDVNDVQIEIIKKLVERHRQICVVGDPDQCIYSWRGSKPDSLEHFLTLFGDSKTIVLTENYRNPPKILSAAARLMASCPNRMPRQLHAVSPLETQVNFWNFHSGEERDLAIVNLLERYLGSHIDMVQADELDHGEKKQRFEDIAILFRTQEEGKEIAKLLKRKGYPYQMSTPENFWEKEEVKAFMEQFANNQKLFEPEPQSRRPKTKNLSFSAFLRSNLSSFISAHTFTNDQQTALFQLLSLSMDFDNLPVSEAICSFLDLPKISEDQDNLINIPGIRLLTLHAAKGLEFQIVIIVGLEEGNIPQKSAMKNQDELAEERRLLYVGMTRAKNELHLMAMTQKPISRFLTEILIPKYLEKQEISPKKLKNLRKKQAKRAQMKIF